MMFLRGWGYAKKLFNIISTRSMSSTHVERTADSSRDEVFSWVTVKDIHQVSPTVKGFTLGVTDKELKFLAGQWVDLHIPALDVVGGYSIVSPPHQLSEKQTLDLAIKYSDHSPTLWMSTSCAVGDRLKIRVGGDFHYSPPVDKELTDLLLIGGGVGINPLFSMLSHHTRLLSDSGLSSGRGGRVQLLYSSKTEGELMFKDGMRNIASGCDGVKVQYFVTAAESTSDPGVKCGRISSADVVAAVNSLDSANLRCYVCGPPPMTEAMMEILLENCRLFQSQIHCEKWW